MRSFTLSILTAGLMLAFPAMAQDPWANTDPNCAPEFHDRAREAAEAAQEKSLADAQATDDFNVKIKDAPMDDSGKLLSCVDEVWPALSGSQIFSGIETFLKNVADKSVEDHCNERRNELRQKRSHFANEDFLVDQMRTVANPGNGNPGGGNQPPPGYQQPNPGGGNQPPSPILPPPGNQQPNPGGGIGDLIRPRPIQPTPPSQPPQPPPGSPGTGIQ